MKVLTILGTRPEVIRLSRVIPKLDALCEHVVLHTGQNYDYRLDGLFFEQLQVRQPDHHLQARGSFGEQIGTILAGCERIMTQWKPDRFLVLGDTNSSLGAIMAKRLGIPVFHMEAGNRCYDDRVPEEVNRRLIDHSSDVLMPYTERSRQNLLREGIEGQRIFVTGNPIFEVLNHYRPGIDGSRILDAMGVAPRQYFLATVHRAENVDDPLRLGQIIESFERVVAEHGMPVIVSTHPRTRARLAARGEQAGNPLLRFCEPFGFFDFVRLEEQARCVLSDSGTVQEECAILRVPNVTLRDTTERPETIECGSNLLSGVEPESVLRCVRTALAPVGTVGPVSSVSAVGEVDGSAAPCGWSAPPEYLVPHVSDTVARIVLGYTRRRS